MLILRGVPALSEFRCRKLLGQLQNKVPTVIDVVTEFQYFIHPIKKLSAAEQTQLSTLLAGEAVNQVTDGEQNGIHKTEFWSVPSEGIQSHWSYDAAKIVQASQIKGIGYLERGAHFILSSEGAMTAEQVGLIEALLYDVTKQTLVDSYDALQSWFEQAYNVQKPRIVNMAYGMPRQREILHSGLCGYFRIIKEIGDKGNGQPISLLNTLNKTSWAHINDNGCFLQDWFDTQAELTLTDAPIMPAAALIDPHTGNIVDLLEAMKRVIQAPAVASKSFATMVTDHDTSGLVSHDQMIGPWQLPVGNCVIKANDFDGIDGIGLAFAERQVHNADCVAATERMAIAEAITNIASAKVDQLGEVKLLMNHGQMIEMANQSELDNNDALPEGCSAAASVFANVSDIQQVVTPQLITNAGNTDLILVDLGCGQQRLGGSIFAEVLNIDGGSVPDVVSIATLQRFFAAIQQLATENLLLAYHDRSRGGLFATLMEMAFAGHSGIQIKLEKIAATKMDILPALFNEELGAVLQVRHSDKGRVKDVLAEQGFGRYAHAIGRLADGQQIRFSFNGVEKVRESRVRFQWWWAENSYAMQLLNKNTECARHQFYNLLDDHDAGLHASLPFNIAKDVTAPFLTQESKPKVAILRGRELFTDGAMAAALEKAGFDVEEVQLQQLLKKGFTLNTYRGLVVSTGFGWTGVEALSASWAQAILLNPTLTTVLSEFFQREDTFTLGVGNGCQLLANIKTLIPGTTHWPHFRLNHSECFEAGVVMAEVLDSNSIFLQGMKGARMPVRISHTCGCIEFATINDFSALQEHGQMAVRFVNNLGKETMRYPYNPNGSQAGMTGFSSEDGRVMIMMPHPEQAFRTVQNSWHPNNWGEDAPWMRIFRNARVWVG